MQYSNQVVGPFLCHGPPLTESDFHLGMQHLKGFTDKQKIALGSYFRSLQSKTKRPPCLWASRLRNKHLFLKSPSPSRSVQLGSQPSTYGHAQCSHPNSSPSYRLQSWFTNHRGLIIPSAFMGVQSFRQSFQLPMHWPHVWCSFSYSLCPCESIVFKTWKEWVSWGHSSSYSSLSFKGHFPCILS